MAAEDNPADDHVMTREEWVTYKLAEALQAHTW